MGRKFHILPIAAMVLLAIGVNSAGAAALPATKKVLTAKSKDFDISVAYPQTGNAQIDKVLRDYATQSLKGFAHDSAARQPGDPTYTLDTTYSVVRNDAKVFAVLFSVYTDMGGAHPNGDYRTFNFLLPDGAQVFLPEIVDGRSGLKRISDIVTADLIKRIGTGPDSMSDPETIRAGTAPYAYNFGDFILEPAMIHLYFPAYQVAAYAVGPQEAEVPLSALKNVLRSDWRAPAPSFDCKAAKTAIERAICADATLARLDRQVAESYEQRLHNAYPDSEKDTLKQAQRDFVAARNKACGASEQMATCLTKAYTARLAALNASY